MVKCPSCGHEFEDLKPGNFSRPNTRSIFSDNSSSIFPNNRPMPMQSQPSYQQPQQQPVQPQQQEQSQPVQQPSYQQPEQQKPVFQPQPSSQSSYQSHSEPVTQQRQHIAITTGNRTISPEEQEKRKREQESAARILSFAAQGKKTR